MLAAITTDALVVVDPATLKKAPSSVPSCLDLLEEPTTGSWAPDNSCLFIASAHTIQRYEPTSNTLRDVYTTETADPIVHLVAKDTSTLIFAAGSAIYILDCSGTPEITHTFNSHKTPITSLTLSNDYTLLASTSAASIHVHNLALGSHTVLRGAPSNIGAAVFHPHSRIRLLVGAEKQLLVYDTTRPSGPLKAVSLSDSAVGDITAISCSPFSKALVAVATPAGSVGLIDLDKDKSLFRVVNLKLPVSTIEFSPEGATIYVGTEKGKVILIELRHLDKPHKTIVVSESGQRIQALCIQRKIKAEGTTTTKTPPSTSTVTTTKTPAQPLPALRRAISTTKPPVKGIASPAQPLASSVSVKVGATKQGSPVSTNTRKKVLSPVRDPHGNSRDDDILNKASLRGGLSSTTPVKLVKKASTSSLRPRPSPSPRASTLSTNRLGASSKAVSEVGQPRKARTLPVSSAMSSVAPGRSATRKVSTATEADRKRTVSSASASASRAGRVKAASPPPIVDKAPKPVPSVNLTAASRPSSSASRPASSISRISSRPSAHTQSRSPSPELPAIDRSGPTTPLTGSKTQKNKKTGMSVLGLGTPEVKKWIQSGDGEFMERKASKTSLKEKQTAKGKSVGFQDGEDEDEDEMLEKERVLSLQISPRRLPTSNTASSTDSWAALAASASAASNAAAASGAGVGAPSTSSGGAPPNSAHDLLKTIVQDVMFDFQRETKAELMGLHLDLLRMGRGWKNELRVLMDEYVGDLRDLREENERLRKENERLRRVWD